VLHRPKIARTYAISPGDRQAFVALLHADGLLLPEAPPGGVCRDPDGDCLPGCAATGGVDYLVTGDADLLILGRYRDVRIIDARTLLTILSA
jgi:predicted nucleic acid-binding protein